MKIAIIHDWLVTFAGAERVLEQILLCYPHADLFSVIDFFSDELRDAHLLGKKATTTFIQKLPHAKNNYRNYLPLMPLAIKQFDLAKYDLIISDSHAIAKGVNVKPHQVHISYVHSPMRYAWDLRDQYLKESGLDKGLKSILAKLMLDQMRRFDLRTVNKVNYFACNSKCIAARIKNNYKREAKVIYPAVDVDYFAMHADKEDFYVTASRMVPYKKIDLIVEAFSQMPDKKLIVIGDGPDWQKIIKLGASNITFLGFKPTAILKHYLQRAKAFVFAAEEDFGIVPLEAQACGTPVIAFGKGGVLETVRSYPCAKPTGLFFSKQEIDELQHAVAEFEKNQQIFVPENCRENALCFTPEKFRQDIMRFVSDCLQTAEI